MAIKDILAVVDTGDTDEQFLHDALAFAEFHDAHLSIVILSALPSADYALTIVPPYSFLQDYTEAVEAKQQRIAKLAGASNVEVRTISDQPAIIYGKAAVYARYADIVLFGPADNYDYPPIRRETIERILFASGRPVLVAPNGHKPRAIDISRSAGMRRARRHMPCVMQRPSPRRGPRSTCWFSTRSPRQRATVPSRVRTLLTTWPGTGSCRRWSLSTRPRCLTLRRWSKLLVSAVSQCCRSEPTDIPASARWSSVALPETCLAGHRFRCCFPTDACAIRYIDHCQQGWR